MQRLELLFNAMSQGNIAAVRNLITAPAPGRDGLEMSPSLARVTRSSGSDDIQVHSEADLVAFMRDAAGYSFVLTAASGGAGTGLQAGPGAWTGPAVALGPITWRAVPKTNSSQGVITGAGKALVECPSGDVQRLLLSPGTAAARSG